MPFKKIPSTKLSTKFSTNTVFSTAFPFARFQLVPTGLVESYALSTSKKF